MEDRARPSVETPAKVIPVISPPKRWRWRRVIWIVVVVLVAIGVGIAWRLRPARKAQVAGARDPRSAPQVVGLATVTSGSIPIVLNALGTVAPLATVTVKTQVSGYLLEIGFKEGQLVKKGDFIAQVDPRPYQALLAQNQAQLARDRAMLEDAQVNLTRYQTLFSQDSIAKQTLDTQLATVHEDMAAIQMDQALIDTQRLNLAYCHIVAPVDGRVGLRQVDAGNYVQSSDANGIVVITKLQPISVLFSLPEDSLPEVMKRLASGARLPATAFDRTGTRKIAEGALTTVDNQVDPTTGTVKLRALFPNGDLALFPQQFVNIRLLVNTVEGAALVPNAAVQRGAPGTFVYLVSPNHIVSVHPISIGPSDDRFTSIAVGLTPGDRVVVDGADRLRDGDRVMWNEPGSAGAIGAPGGFGQQEGIPRAGAREGAPRQHPEAPAPESKGNTSEVSDGDAGAVRRHRPQSPGPGEGMRGTSADGEASGAAAPRDHGSR